MTRRSNRRRVPTTRFGDESPPAVDRTPTTYKRKYIDLSQEEEDENDFYDACEEQEEPPVIKTEKVEPEATGRVYAMIPHCTMLGNYVIGMDSLDFMNYKVSYDLLLNMLREQYGVIERHHTKVLEMDRAQKQSDYDHAVRMQEIMHDAMSSMDKIKSFQNFIKQEALVPECVARDANEK